MACSDIDRCKMQCDFCRLILYRLETVDLRRMTSEEKLAFWINVHNALVMHVTF